MIKFRRRIRHSYLALLRFGLQDVKEKILEQLTANTDACPQGLKHRTMDSLRCLPTVSACNASCFSSSYN